MKLMKYYQCFVDNQWVDASDGERLAVDNPATGECFAEVPACKAADAELALQSSERARSPWALLPPVERAGYVYRICEALKAERSHFARLLVMEQGKTLAEAEFEVDDTVRYMSYAAEAARRIQGEILPADLPNEQLYIYRVPYGITLGICAYNYPLALIGRKLGPALVAGNVMIMKPHESTPITASEFCRLVEQAEVPRGVVNMLTGTGAELGQYLVESPVTRMISVTGSIQAGQAIAASAAKNLAALSLELGGNAPFIVLRDADIDAAVEAAAVARFSNAGQVCICNESVLVEGSVADEFTEKLLARVAQIKLADPMTNAGMGPVTTAGSLERIQSMVTRSVAQGAEVAVGGRRGEGSRFGKGYWYEPTVLLNARPDSTAVTDELFGPVLPIVRVDDYEQALSIANSRPDGLSAYLWTRNPSVFMNAIARIETGTIFLNKGIVGYVNGYHNGHKLSGLGGEDGTHGLEGYMQKRTVYMAY